MLSEHQIQAIPHLMNRLSLIHGGPGTGKSFTLSHYIRDLAYTKKVAACAPTGKAAARLTDYLEAQRVPIVATTIHRLLEPYYEKGYFYLTRGPENPLDEDLVVVDESSMIDIRLMSMLMSAIDFSKTRAIFCGDPFQIPPVGKGKPFADLLASGLPQAHLTEIHRHAGDIAQVCGEVREKREFNPPDRNLVTMEDGCPHNFLHCERGGPGEVMKELKRLLNTLVSASYNLDDVQVIVPLNKNGELSRKNLNDELRGIFNPLYQRNSRDRFQVGDRVIITKNQQVGKGLVCNGDMGTVEFFEKGELVVDLGRNRIAARGEALNNIELGFAITGHKSQGSQWPITIFVADPNTAADRVMGARLFYTAISRASKLSCTIGSAERISKLCRKKDLEERRTRLRGKVESCLERKLLTT